MKLGSLSLKNNLLLAPLQNITTPPFRRFCRYFYDIGMVFEPMVYVRSILKSPESLEQILTDIEEERPISIQLIGNNPDNFRNALDFLESYNYAGIDINAGCPSKRVLKFREGGYLLRDLKSLKKIIEIMGKYSKNAISLKTRIGFEESLNFIEFSDIINNSQLDFITIHARNVVHGFHEEKLDLIALKKLKSLIEIPIVGNGDINSPLKAKKILDFTGVDAIMIGRAAIGNPSIFKEISYYLEKDILIKNQNNLKQFRKHINIYMAILNKYCNGKDVNQPKMDYMFTELKRNAIWLTKNLYKSRFYRIMISKTRYLEELNHLLERILNREFLN